MKPQALVAEYLGLDKCAILAATQHRGFRSECPEQRSGERNLCRPQRRKSLFDMAGCVIGKRAGQSTKGGSALRPALR